MTNKPGFSAWLSGLFSKGSTKVKPAAAPPLEVVPETEKEIPAAPVVEQGSHFSAETWYLGKVGAWVSGRWAVVYLDGGEEAYLPRKLVDNNLGDERIKQDDWVEVRLGEPKDGKRPPVTAIRIPA